MRHYHGTSDKAPDRRLGLGTKELERLLDEFRQSANLGVEDLGRLIAAAEELAAVHHMGAQRCGDFMSRDLVMVGPAAPVGRVAGLFRQHGFTSIPVVAADDVLLGVIFQIDLIRHARRAASWRHMSFNEMLTQFTGTALRKPPRARDIMPVGLPTVTAETAAGALLDLLQDGGPEAATVMDGARIVGIVTRSDLISARARGAARNALPAPAERSARC